MYVVVSARHKLGRVQSGSEVQLAFADYLQSHPGHPDVVVHNAGPTHDEDFNTPVGFLLVVEASSVDSVRAFIADSPYGKADTLAETDIRTWDWRTGRPGD